MKINWTGVGNQSTVGQLLSLPLRFLPGRLVFPIVAGRNCGTRWVGAFDHGVLASQLRVREGSGAFAIGCGKERRYSTSEHTWLLHAADVASRR
jgi:hypothetical protein